MGNVTEQLSEFDASKPSLNIKICFGDLAASLTHLKIPDSVFVH